MSKASNIVEIPALIDMHCHLREPGYEYKEDISTGSLAALRGGFGIICPMPNTNPVCDNIDILKRVLSTPSNVTLAPICAITKGLESDELVDFAALRTCGAVGFSNDGKPVLNPETFRKALESGELIISHCEDEPVEVAWQIEVFESVKKDGKVAPRLHFCHISQAKSIELIRTAKARGLDVTAETAPHYFTFTNESVTQDGTFKMNPPLAGEKDRKAVIGALKEGTLDVIATDHAPHSNEENLRPFNEATFGITGFETALALGLKHFDIDFLVEKMAVNPAKIFGIKNEKKIKVDLGAKWIFKAAESASKCKVSPYDGMEFTGKVVEYAK